MSCERTGINPQWPDHTDVMRRVATEQAAFDRMLDNARECPSHAHASPAEMRRDSENISPCESEDFGRLKVNIALATAPINPDWLGELAFWALYYQTGHRMEFFWHHQYRLLFRNHPDGGLKWYDTEQAAHLMGVMALLGWRAATEHQGYLVHAALNRGYQATCQYTERHGRAQAFMLRLFADWAGDVCHTWPDYLHDEPVYETLLQIWRTPNPENLVAWLLTACDRHTHRVMHADHPAHDFHDAGLIRTPIEILLLLRLREWEGLANPVLDHPLMTAPFDRLPEAQPVPEADAWIRKALARAREDWPNYDEVLSLATLKS